MAFEIIGKLHKKFGTEQKTPSFSTREFVIYTEDEQYPQYIKFQLTQDRCTIIDSYQEGEKLKVHFDLRGREWQGKYFTNLNAWRIEKVDSANTQGNDSFTDTPFPTEMDAPAEESDSEGSFNDDLPF